MGQGGAIKNNTEQTPWQTGQDPDTINFWIFDGLTTIEIEMPLNIWLGHIRWATTII